MQLRNRIRTWLPDDDDDDDRSCPGLCSLSALAFFFFTAQAGHQSSGRLETWQPKRNRSLGKTAGSRQDGRARRRRQTPIGSCEFPGPPSSLGTDGVRRCQRHHTGPVARPHARAALCCRDRDVRCMWARTYVGRWSLLPSSLRGFV